MGVNSHKQSYQRLPFTFLRTPELTIIKAPKYAPSELRVRGVKGSSEIINLCNLSFNLLAPLDMKLSNGVNNQVSD